MSATENSNRSGAFDTVQSAMALSENMTSCWTTSDQTPQPTHAAAMAATMPAVVAKTSTMASVWNFMLLISQVPGTIIVPPMRSVTDRTCRMGAARGSL